MSTSSSPASLWNSGLHPSLYANRRLGRPVQPARIYDYLTDNQDDPLYPGGGSDGYDEGENTSEYYNNVSSDDAAFLATYNPDPSSATDGGSPEYFNNSANFNGYWFGIGWAGLRDVQIAMPLSWPLGRPASTLLTRIAGCGPCERQYGGNWSNALNFISSVYGSQHPVSYYLYGAGGGWYADDPEDGFSDVSFANPAFADGLTGWSSDGSAGVVANGSSMGNPQAPPLFSAIAITNGATSPATR